VHAICLVSKSLILWRFQMWNFDGDWRGGHFRDTCGLVLRHHCRSSCRDLSGLGIGYRIGSTGVNPSLGPDTKPSGFRVCCQRVPDPSPRDSREGLEANAPGEPVAADSRAGIARVSASQGSARAVPRPVTRGSEHAQMCRSSGFGTIAGVQRIFRKPIIGALKTASRRQTIRKRGTL